MRETRNVAVDWEEHAVNLGESLKELRENDSFLDVTLVSDGDIQVLAHKNILSVNSHFFRNMLRKNPHPHPMIYLKGLEHTDLAALVDFMYCGKVKVAQDNLDRFLLAAKDLKIKGLCDMEEKPFVGQAKVSKESLSMKTTNLLGMNFKEYDTLEGTSADDIEAVLPVTVVEENIPEILTELKNADSNKALKEENRETFVYQGNLDETENIKAQSLDEKIRSLFEKKDNFWQCKVCQKFCKQVCQIKNHVETHIEGISVDCKVCGKTYKSRSVLAAHKSKCMRDKMNKTS